MPSKPKLKIDNDDPELSVLIKDYELLSLKHERAEDKFFQFVSWIIVILTTFTSVISSQISSSQLAQYLSWLAWLGPFITVFMFCILLFQFYEVEGLIRKCRVIMEEINKRLERPVMTQYSNAGQIDRFFSVQHGNIKYRVLMWGEIALAGILYVVASGISLAKIYADNHLGGVLIASVFAIATCLLLYSFSGAIFDLPRHYKVLQDQMEGMQDLNGIPEINRSLALIQAGWRSGWKSFLGLILPRPRDLIEKGTAFWYGFVAGLAILGIQDHQLPIINSLFKYQTNDFTLSSVPSWAVWGLGFAYFFVEEVLLQQAKLLWDDVRDIEKDRQSPHHKIRAFTQGLMSESAARIHVVLRWTLAFVLGYLVGGPAFLWLLLLISFHQAFYVLWGKPRGARHPVILLMIISFNISFRLIAGVMAVVGSSWSYFPFLALFAIFHFYSFGFMAALWKMEAIHIRENPEPDVLERPQSSFFYSKGEAYRYQGQIGAILLSACLIATYWFFSSCNTNLYPFIDLIGKCSQNKLALYASFNPPNALLVMLSLMILFHFLTIVVRFVFTPVAGLIYKLFDPLKGIVTVVSFLIFIICLVAAAISGYAFVYLWGILFMNVGLLAMLQGLNYEGFVGKEMTRQIPALLRCWADYFFKSSPGNYSFMNMVAITIKVLNNKTVFPPC